MNVRSLWMRADFENLLPAQAGLVSQLRLGRHVVALVVFLAESALVPAVFDVAKQLDAELVGIQPRRASWPACRSGGRQ